MRQRGGMSPFTLNTPAQYNNMSCVFSTQVLSIMPKHAAQAWRCHKVLWLLCLLGLTSVAKCMDIKGGSRAKRTADVTGTTDRSKLLAVCYMLLQELCAICYTCACCTEPRRTYGRHSLTKCHNTIDNAAAPHPVWCQAGSRWSEALSVEPCALHGAWH